MKSMKFIAVAGAVAMLSTAGFTSCKPNNSPEGPGNYNGEVVKTEFSISIPGAKPNVAGAPDVLRMPADNTQSNNEFHGMDNIILMPFATANTSSPAAVTASDKRLGNNINLAAIANTGLTTAHHKVYTNVSIPIGTNRFLFYAHGKAASSTKEDKFNNGLLDATGFDATTPSASFEPVQIFATGDDTEGKNLADFLTSIAKAKIGDDAGESWATYTSANGGNDGIKQLYDDFTGSGMHAGSATSILALLEDLYNSLETYNEAYKLSTPAGDAVVMAIMDAILGGTVDPKIKINTGGTAGNRTLAWKDATTFRTYPANIPLPDGAAAIVWQAVDAQHPEGEGFPKFVILPSYEWAAANVTPTPPSLNIAALTAYVYPACIYYYVNSELRTSIETPLTTNSDAIAPMAWDDVISGYYNTGTTTDYVTTTTRSVAIKDQIQYGVARLETMARAAGATLKDNKEKDITAANLSMTAVLVGGQGPVGFDFSTDATGTKIIYDKNLASGDYALPHASATYTTGNPTLVLETKPDEKILVAIEFLNNDQDFYGINNQIIPKGTKFYVVAQLDASAHPVNAQITAAGKDGCVFAQDFTTTIKLTLNDLKKAYNVVPDLRTAALELGFSVDLSWQDGYIFEVEI